MRGRPARGATVPTALTAPCPAPVRGVAQRGRLRRRSRAASGGCAPGPGWGEGWRGRRPGRGTAGRDAVGARCGPGSPPPRPLCRGRRALGRQVGIWSLAASVPPAAPRWTWLLAPPRGSRGLCSPNPCLAGEQGANLGFEFRLGSESAHPWVVAFGVYASGNPP